MIQYANIGTVETRKFALVQPIDFEFKDDVGATWEDLTTKTIRLRWYKDEDTLVFELTSAAPQIQVTEDTVTFSPDAAPMDAATARAAGSAARFATWGAVPALDYTFRLDVIDPTEEPKLGLVALWKHQPPGFLNGTAHSFENATTVDTVGQTVQVTVTGGGGGGGGTDDQIASEVPFTPAGDIAATDVQAAIEELDTEKAAASNVLLLTRKVVAGSGNSSGVGFYRITGSSVTLTFTSADIANSLLVVAVKNESATTATLATEGAETIEGLPTLSLFAGGAVWLYSDGSNLRQIMP